MPIITADNPVVRILMQRDSLPPEDAIALVQECAQHMMQVIQSGLEDPEEIMMDELGLEPDFMFEILPV